MSFCFFKEKNLCLGTTYKTKDVFIRSSYYYYCEKKAGMKCRIKHFARESVGFCPYRGSEVKEFQLSHSNPVNRIIKITHACEDVGLCSFYNSYLKQLKLFCKKISYNDFKKSPRLYNTCIWN